jgi:hypothetical protein
MHARQGDLASFPPDSTAQQAAVMEVADTDLFQWGYDPVHWGVPEGSYSVEVDGAGRTREFRQMVQSLHRLGLNVVLDVVYNHTFQSTAEGERLVIMTKPGLLLVALITIRSASVFDSCFFWGALYRTCPTFQGELYNLCVLVFNGNPWGIQAVGSKWCRVMCCMLP